MELVPSTPVEVSSEMGEPTGQAAPAMTPTLTSTTAAATTAAAVDAGDALDPDNMLEKEVVAVAAEPMHTEPLPLHH